MSTTTILKPSVIQPNERILITGANGFIGSHVTSLFLSLGYLVRGTIRVEKPWLDQFFESKYGPGKYESVIVPELNSKDDLARVMTGVSGVVHVATDTSFSTDATKVIDYVISSTEAILRAASAQKSVKRVVLTSSAMAAWASKPGVEGIVITEKSWNDLPVESVREGASRNPLMIYATSKIESERAAWEWVKDNKPHYIFNSVLPNLSIGRVLHPEIRGSSAKAVAELVNGNAHILQAGPGWYVNVEDVALLHAVALLDPEVRSERLFAFAAHFTWTEIISLLQQLRPDSDRIANPPENELPDLSVVVPSKRAKDLLRSFFGKSGWAGLEQSLKEALDSLGI